MEKEATIFNIRHGVTFESSPGRQSWEKEATIFNIRHGMPFESSPGRQSWEKEAAKYNTSAFGTTDNDYAIVGTALSRFDVNC